jgi:SAM-dependent methyltransferase
VIKKWILKAVVQKTISFLPGSQQLNYFFQKYVTKGVFLSDDYFFDRLGHAAKHLSFFEKFAKMPFDSTLELGTGWYPVAPISMFLCGANRVVSMDISPLMTREHLLTTLLKFQEANKNGQLEQILPIKKERLAILENIILQNRASKNNDSLAHILEKFNFEYVIIDARKTNFTAETFSFIHSNNVFEHVYPPVLAAILEEFQRILNKNGVMSHFFDGSDHFAHFDKTINIYHFLQYSDRAWALIDNDVQPQNRFRFRDYLELYEKLRIEIVETDIRKGDLNLLSKVRVNQKFASYLPAELAISHGYLVSKF